MKKIIETSKLIIFLITALISVNGFALPINFGVNQGDMEYSEMVSDNFRVYFDSRVPEEGAMAMQSLESAKPLMEKWMGAARDIDDPLKVVMSNVTRNASFANFIVDAIELQTPRQNIRDLAWHEYTHSSMYIHFNNIFGTPGSILHTLWMPAWFLEGLAEVFSVSAGSDYQSGVERWQALSGKWPTYDRLHSLYQNPKWSGRGYATAGSFVAWLLRKMYTNPASEIKNLAELLQDFKDETMPWAWFTNMALPMEDTFEKSTGMHGEGLYELYKREANAYWQVASPYPFLSGDKRRRLYLRGGKSLHTRGKFSLFFQREGKHLRRYRAVFDPRSGWMVGVKKSGSLLPKDAIEKTYLKSNDLRAYVISEKPVGHAYRDALLVSLNKRMGGPVEPTVPIEKETNIFETNINLKFEKDAKFQKVYIGGEIIKLFETSNRIAWYEVTEKDKKLCTISKRTLKKQYSENKPIEPQCQIIAKGSYNLEIIGDKTKWSSILKSFVTHEIWFRITDSSTTGDRHSVVVWNARTKKVTRKKAWPVAAKPVNVAFAGKETWVLASDRSKTHLWKVDSNLRCIETLPLSDFVLSAHGLQSGHLVIKLYEGFNVSVRKLKPSKFKKGVCYSPVAHTSPLMEGMKSIYAQARASSAPKTAQASNKGDAETQKDIIQKIENVKIPDFREVILKTTPWKKEFLAEAKIRKNERDRKKVDPNQSIKQSKEKEATVPMENELASEEERFESFKKSPNLKDEIPWTGVRQHTAKDAKEAELRWSSPLYFPWIGGEDYLGTQLGLISIPLIDDLQNQQIRATFLLGLESQFPSIDVSYTNNTYKWPIRASVFKKQSYNGYLTAGENYFLNYWDETGLKVSTAKYFRLWASNLLLDTGVKFSNLDVLIGYDNFNKFSNGGMLIEPYLNLSLSKKITGRLTSSLGLGYKYAGNDLNEEFDYHKYRASANLSLFAFSASTFTLGVEYAKTTGDRPTWFREFYTPLKTHIPGSGGGLNQSNKLLIGQGFLFASGLGDTKLRYKLNYTTPLIDDLDKLVWILYAERLDFSAFVNYGAIWDEFFLGQTLDDVTYIGAHGYNVDLQFENKGVRFNVGLGIGQVFERDFEIYAKAGFDAFF
jgi:hypothetical protein